MQFDKIYNLNNLITILMRNCILKLVIVSILLIGPFGINATNGDTDDFCNSVTNILLNKTLCDIKAVEVEGKVTDLNFTISNKGNKYTSFNLSDSKNKVKVFSFEYLPVAEKDVVRVKGIYFIDKLYENYTFHNEIDTMPSGVTILKHERLLHENYILISLLGVAIPVLFYLLKKNREKIRKKLHYGKGSDFEKHVLSLFDQKQWSIENVTGDISEEIGRRVKSDSDPDITVKHLASGKKFSIECKYRSRFEVGKKEYGIRWAEPYQISNYGIFQKEKGHQVYVVIGVGGIASKPNRLFLVPLYALRYPFAGESYLKLFERNVDSKFITEDDALK